MKKQLLKILSALFLGAIIIYGCTQEIEVLESFDFTLETEIKEEGFMLENTGSNFKIIPERIVDDTDYFFSYRVRKGAGKFNIINEDDDLTKLDSGYVKVLKQDSLYPLKKLIFDANYYSEKIGLNIIDIKVTDNKGREKKARLKLNVIYAPFSFDVKKTTNDYPIGSQTPFVLTLLNKKEGDQKFEVKYDVFDADGTFLKINEKSRKQELIEVPTQKIDTVNEGSTTWQYLPKNVGKHYITIVGTNIDGKKLERDIEIDVRNIKWDFEAFVKNKNVNINDEVPVTVNLKTRDDNVEPTYKYSYEIIENTGKIVDRKGNDLPTEPIEIKDGVKTLKFLPKDLGDVRVKFIAENNFGEIKTDTVNIVVEKPTYKFNVSNKNNESIINSINDIFVSLKTNGNNQKAMDYTMRYELLKGEGKLLFKEKEVQKGADLKIEDGEYSYKFIPSKLGKQKLRFYLIDSFDDRKEIIIEINVVDEDFIFEMSTNKTNLIINEAIPVRFDIENSNRDMKYQMKLEVINGTAIVKNNNDVPVKLGIYKPLNNRLFSYTFKPTETGDMTLKATIKDENGQEKTKIIEFGSKYIEFDFNAVAGVQNIQINEKTPINFSLIPKQEDSNTKYSLTYEILKGSGTIKNGNMTLNPGIALNVKKGTWSYDFIPNTLGNDTSVKFTLSDNYGNKKDVIIKFNVIQVNFTFVSTGSSDKPLIDKGVQVTHNITSNFVNTGTKYEMSFSSSKNGTVSYNGNSYKAEEKFEVYEGDFNSLYIPKELGEHKIIYTVKSSKGITKNSNFVTLMYKANNLNLQVIHLNLLYLKDKHLN